jgi:hypothetical protein
MRVSVTTGRLTDKAAPLPAAWPPRRAQLRGYKRPVRAAAARASPFRLTSARLVAKPKPPRRKRRR